jgi:N-acetylmuramoyl-L-alanine amidase
MQGVSVRQIQERLNSLGANPRLVADGVFGPRTEAAVVAFQRQRGLNTDGIVGPITWNALFPRGTAPPPPQRTIVIDPGHGGSDAGATFGSRRESDDNLRLSLAVQRLLQEQGLRVILTRSTDVNVPLSERSAISNRNNADLFVSIHRNASTNTSANGVENFVFTTAPTNTVQSAFDVLDEIVNAGVQNNRGVRRGNFAVIRNTNAPAMLLEMGFISNARDNQLFDQNFNAYAAAIARGIINALNDTQHQYFFYTAVSGDNLWTVAQRFGTTQSELIQLNKLTTNNLIVGQILKIPR